MTNKQINIAIAEVCNKVIVDKWGEKYPIPDYCKDNAMHDAENVLNKKQWVAYGRELSRLNVFPMVHANARQRAEAFLKTIGKWEEQ
jgi:hypothetical protein